MFCFPLFLCSFSGSFCDISICVTLVFVENFVRACFYVIQLYSYCEWCDGRDVRREPAVVNFITRPICSSHLRLNVNEICLANYDFNMNFVIVV